GIPSNILPLMAAPGSAPVINPNAFAGGVGGGRNWTSLTDGLFGKPRGPHTTYNLSTSATKTPGRWEPKARIETRNLLSNYHDFEESAAAIASQFFQQGGNFNAQYLNASGGAVPQNANNNQLGVNGAGLLLGGGLWWIRPGANVQPAFSQKYFAAYS